MHLLWVCKSKDGKLLRSRLEKKIESQIDSYVFINTRPKTGSFNVISEHQEKYFDLTKEEYEDYEETVKALSATQEAAANANTAIFLQEQQRAMDELVAKISGIELKVCACKFGFLNPPYNVTSS